MSLFRGSTQSMFGSLGGLAGPKETAAAAAEPQDQPDERGAALQGVAWSATLAGLGPWSLQSTTITLYPNEDFRGNGSQIGACDVMVSYAVKGGKVRVLNCESAARALLRDHQGTIVDLAFSSACEGDWRWLASCCDSGTTTVWRLSVRHDGEEIPHEKVRTTQGQRAAWQGVTLATALGPTLSVASDDHSASVKAHNGLNILDIKWSETPDVLVTSGADNTVRCWSSTLSVLNEWRLDGPAGQVAAVGPDEALALVDNDLHCLRTRQRWRPFESGRTRLALSGDLVLVASGTLLRVAHRTSEGVLDYATPFDLGSTISSLACIRAPLSERVEDADVANESLGYELHLFCVLTKTIEQFFLRPSTCYPPQQLQAIASTTPPPPPAAAAINDPRAVVVASPPNGASDELVRRCVEDATSRIVDTVREAQTTILDEQRHLASQTDGRLATLEADVARLSKANELLAAAVAPAVEAAVGTMFTTLDTALRERLAAFEKLEATRLEKLYGAITDFNKRNDLAPPDDLDKPSPEEDLKERIAELVETDGDYDGAVYKAVEASDVDVLLFAIERCSARNVAAIQPVPFQQLTLLCLVQQLAATLDHHPDHLHLKLEWIQFAVLALDAHNPTISAHVPEVLRQLKGNLDALPDHLRAKHSAPTAIIAHIVNSLLNSLGPAV